MTATTSASSATPVGLGIKEWAKQVGIAHSSYYIIPENLRPRQVKIGRKVIVIESPREWLERVAKLGGVPSKRSEQQRVAA